MRRSKKSFFTVTEKAKILNDDDDTLGILQANSKVDIYMKKIN